MFLGACFHWLLSSTCLLLLLVLFFAVLACVGACFLGTLARRSAIVLHVLYLVGSVWLLGASVPCWEAAGCPILLILDVVT